MAWLVIPPAFLLWLYSRSFRVWFREDDFPLLGFARGVHSFADFLHMMYAPYAQGTIRPLSERLPFLVSWHLFGADCVPLRIFVMLTAMADLLLIAVLARRLTGSRLAGTAAAVLWASSASLIIPMTWNSAYNEVQYPLFLLTALLLFVRYADTGRQRFWWMQIAVFVIGFGSLENNIVYPAITAAWALLAVERGKRAKLLVSTIPLFAISAAYYAVHMRIAPAPSNGIYAVHLDSRIFATFAEYWRWAFVSPEWVAHGFPRSGAAVILAIAMASLIAFLAWQTYTRRAAALFPLAWFLIVISPLLLLPDRHTEYYLCGPAIGLALAAGIAIASAWRGNRIWRAASLAIVAAWLSGAIPTVRATTIDFIDQSRVSRNLVLGVVEAHRRHPGKTILLDGVPQAGYDAVIYESGFRAFDVENVYLTPEARKTIQPEATDVTYEGAIVDAAVARHALIQDQAIVYDFSPGHLRNITWSYTDFAEAHFSDAAPSRVQMGNPLYAYLLGPEWSAPERFVRWMPGRATLKIAAPKSPGERIVVSGFCWGEQLARGPVYLAVAADGIPLGETEMRGPDIRFEKTFPAPSPRAGKDASDLAITAWPVAKVGDKSYGVMMESVAIR